MEDTFFVGIEVIFMLEEQLKRRQGSPPNLTALNTSDDRESDVKNPLGLSMKLRVYSSRF